MHPMIMEDNHSLLLKLREEKAFMRARSEVSTEAQEVLMQ